MTAETQDHALDSIRLPHFVQSLEKGLAVLQAFGSGDGELSTSDIAGRTGLSRAAARRFLLTLQDLGYLASDGKVFWLTPRSLNLGYAFLSNLSLPQIAEPHLEWLARQINEAVSVCILDGHDIVYVARVPAMRLINVTINVGTRFPAYATSMGRVLLAGLPTSQLERYLSEADIVPLTDRSVSSADELRDRLETIRERGWSLSKNELMAGLRGVAVPIRYRGEMVAAANASLTADHSDIEQVEADTVPLLLEAAERIERDIAGTDPDVVRSLMHHLRPSEVR